MLFHSHKGISLKLLKENDFEDVKIKSKVTIKI